MTELVGLNEIQRNPNLTFVAFIAFFLIGALGVRFGLYAYWNGRRSTTDAQTMLWGYLLVVGLLSTLYGLAGVLRIVVLSLSDAMLEVAGGLMLGLVLSLALALRSVHLRMADTARMAGDGGGSANNALILGAALAVLATTLALVLLPEFRRPLAFVHGALGVAFLAYGYRFGQRQLSQIQVQGTLLDTLLRHLLPVLLFASLVPVLELTWVVGIPRTVVLYIQIVFVIMTATTLMTATIKLRQNLAGMR